MFESFRNLFGPNIRLQLTTTHGYLLLILEIVLIVKPAEGVGLYAKVDLYEYVRYWPNAEVGSISPTYLRAAFMPLAPKSVRVQSSHQYLFTLWGSVHIKAARRMLMKLTPGDEK